MGELCPEPILAFSVKPPCEVRSYKIVGEDAGNEGGVPRLLFFYCTTWAALYSGRGKFMPQHLCKLFLTFRIEIGT